MSEMPADCATPEELCAAPEDPYEYEGENEEDDIEFGDRWDLLADPDLPTHHLDASIHLPEQTDGWSCLSTTAAFIVGRLTGAPVETREFDAILERPADQAGDSTKFCEWAVNNGYAMRDYRLSSPLHDAAMRYAHGEITFEEYIPLYEHEYGPIPPLSLNRFRTYYEETFKPSVLRAENFFEPYRKTGQVVEYSRLPDAEEIEALLDKRSYAFAFVINPTRQSSHVVGLFREHSEHPVSVFVPSLPENGGSRCIVINSGALGELIAKSELVCTISPWTEAAEGDAETSEAKTPENEI